MIRKATIKDVSRLAEILIFSKRVSYRSIFNNDKVSFGEMQVLPLALEYINNTGLLDNIFVYDDEFVKGMINVSVVSSNVSAEIKELYIDCFFQNQQIGSKLINYAESYIRSLGITKVFLWVLEKNEIAIRFYESHGFCRTNDKELEDGTAEYILKYEKDLR